MTRVQPTGESAAPPQGRPEPVFVELGRTADEADRIEHPGAPPERIRRRYATGSRRTPPPSSGATRWRGRR